IKFIPFVLIIVWFFYFLQKLYFFFKHLIPYLKIKRYNARLKGWQRITTKLKHNNCNHCDSLGLETPRVDSPS
ncbi:hypothetical protein LT010_17305, partial [Vibrio cholerae]|uniref:hypothetical protein n=1 Tax=Vibrio cholerae TaxID=666 RepID=UPI001E5E0EE3